MYRRMGHSCSERQHAGFLNTDQPRHFTIIGDTLVVSETYLSGSTRIRAERVFVREAVTGLGKHQTSIGK